ncbi:MAG: hypothetical protein ACT4OM_09215 [Actinomycetota bacterium]
MSALLERPVPGLSWTSSRGRAPGGPIVRYGTIALPGTATTRRSHGLPYLLGPLFPKLAAALDGDTTTEVPQ